MTGRAFPVRLDTYAHDEERGERVIKYEVREIAGGEGRDYIRRHHYTRTCHNGPMCWGLFSGEDMIGVIAFATPSSENVRSSVFGPEYKDKVTELHRLFVVDGTPKNTESWFISRGIKGLLRKRPQIRGVLSFADSTEGHTGVIYQATNALFCGTTGRSRFWRDPDGRLRHPRQNGHNVTPEEADAMGWTPEMRGAKYRYLFLVGNKRWAKAHLKLKPRPYPNKEEERGDASWL